MIAGVRIGRQKSEKEGRSYDFFWKVDQYHISMKPLDVLFGARLWKGAEPGSNILLEAANRLEQMVRDIRHEQGK